MMYRYTVSYDDGTGKGKRKTAIIRSKDGSLDDFIVLQEVLEEYGDYYAEDYKIEIEEEKGK